MVLLDPWEVATLEYCYGGLCNGRGLEQEDMIEVCKLKKILTS